MTTDMEGDGMKFSDFEATYHIMDMLREERRKKLEEAGGCGNVVCGVYWDKGHPNGAEMHVLTTNAIIFVFNSISHKLVTFKFARPGQIRQLYGRTNVIDGTEFNEDCVPQEVLSRALFYKNNGWNNI